MTRIALDAMGGDNAPGEIVLGGIEAAQGLEDVKVLLVGVQSQIEAEFAKHPKESSAAVKSGKLEIVHAPDVAEMDESPVSAVRKKKNCSINVAMRLVKEGKADAFVSAGNSGAVATSAILNLGRIPGVLRPAIATVLPTRRPIRPLLLLDAGANMDCHADWLVQFAIMGSAYSKAVLKREKPLVGLLSIGTEDCKGNEMTKETFPLLKEVSGIDFRGSQVRQARDSPCSRRRGDGRVAGERGSKEEELFDQRGDASCEGGKGGCVRFRRQLRRGGHERDLESRSHPGRVASGDRHHPSYAASDSSCPASRCGREHGLPCRLARAVRHHGQRLFEGRAQA